MNVKDFDVIIINTSAGKDSQAMMDHVVGLAKEAGILDRVSAVHCDLGRAEWAGTGELAGKQATAYGIPLHIVRREKGDLLAQIEARGMWPSSQARYCTSDQKRDQAAKVIRRIAKIKGDKLGRPVRVLNCQGIRSQESRARAKKSPITPDKRNSTKAREVTIWFPIFDWTEKKVWEVIKASKVPYHRAYDLGMPRLSCMFCIFAPKSALMIAGRANPELLDQYVALEEKMGHDFKNGFKIAEVKKAIENGEKAGVASSWTM